MCLGLMVLPANVWNGIVPPQKWSTIRNLPLMILGLSVAYTMLGDGRGHGHRIVLPAAYPILSTPVSSMSISTISPVTVKMTRSQILVTRSAARSRLCAAQSK